jgi:hypothetical protein
MFCLLSSSTKPVFRLKNSPEYAIEFKKVSFFWDVLQMMSTFHFRLRYRRYILDLFREVEFTPEAFNLLGSA